MKSRAFTLVEMLVALVIVMVTVMGTAGLIAVAHRTARLAEERNAASLLSVEAERAARAVIDKNGPPDPRGTYSVHNVIVEDDKVFLSWYSEGILILDISDPYKPVEIARYHQEGSEFEDQNGGIQVVWGIFKPEGEEIIYASDLNGGLYVLELRDRTE